MGPRTRLAIVDHISADTAIVFPLAAIASSLKRQGVAVLADGAHAPASVALDIPSLGVDWYVGNLHKWAWAPRSSGVLWAAPERQAGLHPAVISWGLDEGFTTEFDMVGTRDPSPHLAAPTALALFKEWGLDDVRRHNHDLAWMGANRLAERWDTECSAPEPLVGSMAMATLPLKAGTSRDEALTMRDSLLVDDGIEVHMHAYGGRVRARISAQIYNDASDIDRLAEAGPAAPAVTLARLLTPGCSSSTLTRCIEAWNPPRHAQRDAPTLCAAAHAVSLRTSASWRR